jgi:hypothetical protein
MEFKKVLQYFIDLKTNVILATGTDVQIDSINTENSFHLCAILLRRYCAKISETLIDDNTSEYFHIILKRALKAYKNTIKANDLQISNSCLSFMKLYLQNANVLVNKYSLTIKKTKILKQFLDYIVNLDDQLYDNEFSLKINRTYVWCVNYTLDSNEFEVFINCLNDQVSHSKPIVPSSISSNCLLTILISSRCSLIKRMTTISSAKLYFEQ